MGNVTNIKSNRQFVLNAMGMHSSKYGGLEKFMVKLASELNSHNTGLIVIYNSVPWDVTFAKDLEKAGGILIVSHAMKPVSYLRSLLTIYKYYHPAIIHAHFQYYYSILFARMLGCRNIFLSLHMMITDRGFNYVHNIRQLPLKARIYRAILYRLTHRVFSMSEAAREQFGKIFPQMQGKTETIYLGSNPNHLSRDESRKNLGVPNDIIILGTIGFNSPVKGLDVLLESMKILRDKYNCFNFILCQIGIDPTEPANDDFIRSVKSRSLTEHVKWLGIRSDVMELLPGMDIYCQPSISETLGLSVIEAGMAGLPLIGSRVGGIPEIINHEKNGFLFEVRDSFKLADYLYQLITDEKMRKRMGDNSKSLVMNNFNMNKQAKLMAEIYLKELNAIDG